MESLLMAEAMVSQVRFRKLRISFFGTTARFNGDALSRSSTAFKQFKKRSPNEVAVSLAYGE